MTVVWLLLVIYGHGALSVPGIATEQECERLYSDLKEKKWTVTNPFGIDHHCIRYQTAGQK